MAANSMMLMLALHGNPGSPADFLPLRTALLLSSDDVFLPLERPRDGGGWADVRTPIDREIASHPGSRVVLIAYSWGCYAAMRYAGEHPGQVHGLVLVNPSLDAENPLSGLALALMRVPLLGAWLAGRELDARVQKFIDGTFAPELVPPLIGEGMKRHLSTSGVWRGAGLYKGLQQHSPIPAGVFSGETAPKILVLRGLADRAVTWSVQRQALDRVGAVVQFIEFEGAGHSLLWTRSGTVAARIRAFIDAIR